MNATVVVFDDDRLSAAIVRRGGGAGSGSRSSSPPIGAISSTIPGAIARSRSGFTTSRCRCRAIEAEAARARRLPACSRSAIGRPCSRRSRRERLGLPGNSPDAAAASGNKREARGRFAAAGLHVAVAFHAADRGRRRPGDDPRLRFPCVAEAAGPVGQPRRHPREFAVKSSTAACAADSARCCARPDVRAARGAGSTIEMLVEGFIPGREVAVEGVLTDGTLQVFAVFDKPDPLDGPFFEETIYVTPLVARCGRRSDAIVRDGPAAHARARTAPRADPCGVPARAVTACSFSRLPRGRSAGCARARCGSREALDAGGGACSAARARRGRLRVPPRERARVGRDDDPDSEARRAQARAR